MPFTFSKFHFQTETKVDILTGVQQYKVNSVSKWMLPYDDCIRVIFLEKLKTTEAHEYAYQYEYNLSTHLLSTLMTYVENILNWPDPGAQMMGMTQNDSL